MAYLCIDRKCNVHENFILSIVLTFILPRYVRLTHSINIYFFMFAMYMPRGSDRYLGMLSFRDLHNSMS